MGKEKTVVQTGGTTQYTPTPEETELNRLQIERERATQQGVIGTQQAGLGLIQQLLSGSTQLPGFFGQMGQGISPEAIGTTASRMAIRSMPYFQSLGITDSGVVPQEIARTIANELLFPAEQFNIGAKQNLLNLALTGQAQVQQPILAGEQGLGARLAGLRSMSQQGMQATYGMNPFMKSFQQNLGQGASGAIFGGMGAVGKGFATPGGMLGQGGSLFGF